MVARRCLNFVNNKYRRGLLDFESAIESDSTPVQNNQQYTVYIEPKCTLERSRLFELIVDLFHNEIEGRQFNIKHTESKIEQLTTKLKQNETPMTLSALEEVINNINDLNTHIDSPLVSHHVINDSVDVSVHEPQTDVHSNNANDHNDNDDI